MSTTLTLDDDLAKLLERRAREKKLPFKRVVNDTLRRGLAAEATSASAKPLRPFKITARDLGLRPGFDPQKLNQLAADLSSEDCAGGGASASVLPSIGDVAQLTERALGAEHFDFTS